LTPLAPEAGRPANKASRGSALALIAGDALEGGKEVSFLGGSDVTDAVRTDEGRGVGCGGREDVEELEGMGAGVLAVLAALEAGRLGGGGSAADVVAVSGACDNEA